MPASTHRVSVFVALSILGAAAPDDATLRPVARIQTDAVPSDGDAADDPAIWIHPSDPARSLIIATDKKGGLLAYRLDGHQSQLVSTGIRPNNVDLLYGMKVDGKLTDLAVASVGKGGKSSGVKVWTIDPADGTIRELGDGPTFTAFDGGDPYGLCTYKSPKDGASYVFVTDRRGAVEQYRLELNGPFRATRVRVFQVGSQAEGIVADRETGKLYVGEEDMGIWEYGAEPSDGPGRRPVAKVGEHGLTADVEGLAIYYAAGRKGYLLASSQGSDSILVYDRAGDHPYVATIDPTAVDGDDVAETDGIDVTNERTSERFPRGLLVVQDGKNPGRQNFKLFAWDEVAGRTLLVDPTAGAR